MRPTCIPVPALAQKIINFSRSFFNFTFLELDCQRILGYNFDIETSFFKIKMTRIISICNQKGGVGKTATAINLGAYLTRLGKYTLLVDLDPQANTTSGIGVNPAILKKSLYDALIGSASLKEIMVGTNIDGLNLIPARPELAGARAELFEIENREKKLQDALSRLKEDNYNYDYILIDCPPELGILTVNGLTASTEVLIPVQCEYYALEGLSQLLLTIDLIKNTLNPEIGILGALLTMYDRRTKLSRDVAKEVKRHFPHRVFENIIPRDVRISESPSFGKTLVEYAPFSRGGRAYKNLASELIALEKEQEEQGEQEGIEELENNKVQDIFETPQVEEKDLKEIMEEPRSGFTV